MAGKLSASRNRNSESRVAICADHGQTVDCSDPGMAFIMTGLSSLFRFFP
jgi:hypothetical protein